MVDPVSVLNQFMIAIEIGKGGKVTPCNQGSLARCFSSWWSEDQEGRLGMENKRRQVAPLALGIQDTFFFPFCVPFAPLLVQAE